MKIETVQPRTKYFWSIEAGVVSIRRVLSREKPSASLVFGLYSNGWICELDDSSTDFSFVPFSIICGSLPGSMRIILLCSELRLI